jgi:hypothetical protein
MTVQKTLWIGDPGSPLPPYAAEVLRIGKGLNANGILIVEVRHDDWCDLLMRGGTCNCDPEVCPGT